MPLHRKWRTYGHLRRNSRAQPKIASLRPLLIRIWHHTAMQAKRRILLVSALAPPAGGIASWTADILASQLSQDFGITVINRNTGSISRRGLTYGVRLAVHNTIITLQVLLLLLIKRPHVLHLCVTGSPIGLLRDALAIFLARWLRTEVVLHFHGNAERLTSRPKLNGCIRTIVARATTLVTLSQGGLDFLARLRLASQLTLLPNSITVSDTPPSKAPPASGPLKVVFAGWLIPAKGLIELLEAIAQCPLVDLHLLGRFANDADRAFETRVRHRIQLQDLKGRVHLHGEVPRDEVRVTMRNCDLFVLPSHSEGFPMALLEAMGVGLPSIVTNVGAMPDAISDGINGKVIDVGDISGLTQALKFYADNREVLATHGTNAWKIALERYSTSQHHTKLHSIWHSSSQPSAH